MRISRAQYFAVGFILWSTFFYIVPNADGQSASPAVLSFPSTAPAAAAASMTTTISGATATYTLELGGPNKDQFTATTAACTDAQLKASTCAIAKPAAAPPPDVVLTVTFRPLSAAPQFASVYAIDSATGAATLIVAITGNGACGKAYSDCDQGAGIGFSLLGGIEQSYLSSEENQTNGFIRAFTKVSVPLNENGTWTINPWAIIRDVGAPAANSNQNLVSAVSNPDGTITSSSLSTIGYSLDFLIGLGFDHTVTKSGQYSLGPIFAFGATTPLSSTVATAAYAVPPIGTEECAQLQTRFASQKAYQGGYLPDLIQGKTDCLINSAGKVNTPVTTLAFAGINRSNFLEKWEVGARTIYRSYTTSGQTSCDPAHSCQRGVVDMTVGQDASITRGLMRHFVFKVDGVQPFPYSGGYLYIFGTAALRFERNTNLSPLILTAATSSGLQSIPTPSIFVEPFLQPDKDFYRIGIGLSIDKIFTSLKKPTQ